MILMRENYNSYKFWDKKINENKTIRGHMFMEKPPQNNSLYIHSLIFNKKNGIDNIFSYFPDERALLGYIQYSFLQEAFYKWIYGKSDIVTKIPSLPVDKIIKDGLKRGKINKDEAKLMLAHYEKVQSMWNIPKDRIVPELIKFSRIFNKTWYGNNKEFLYLKILRNAEELGEFVIESAMIVGNESDFIEKIGLNIEEWRTLCKQATESEKCGILFKSILQKNLSEIL